MHALPQVKYRIDVHRGPPRSTDVQAYVRTFCVHQLPLAEGEVLMGWVVARTAQGGKPYGRTRSGGTYPTDDNWLYRQTTTQR